MAAHDLPDTPEMRATMATTQGEALAKLGLAADSVAVWEDGWRTATSWTTHSSGTCSSAVDDGSTLVATFNTKPQTHPNGPLAPSLLLIYHSADGQKIRVNQPYPAEEFTASTAGCDVRLGPNTVTGDLDSYLLHLEIQGIVADLVMTKNAPSWRPGCRGLVVRRAATALHGLGGAGALRQGDRDHHRWRRRARGHRHRVPRSQLGQPTHVSSWTTGTGAGRISATTRSSMCA